MGRRHDALNDGLRPRGAVRGARMVIGRLLVHRHRQVNGGRDAGSCELGLLGLAVLHQNGLLREGT